MVFIWLFMSQTVIIFSIFSISEGGMHRPLSHVMFMLIPLEFSFNVCICVLIIVYKLLLNKSVIRSFSRPLFSASEQKRFNHEMAMYFYCTGAIGRIPWPLLVQFCCPPSGTTLNLHESIDFCTLSTNSLLSLAQTCSFFVFYDQTSTFFIKISAILFRKLHVIYSYCTSSSLLAGGLHAVLRFFFILLRKIYRYK
jgi:hypothetical protein